IAAAATPRWCCANRFCTASVRVCTPTRRYLRAFRALSFHIERAGLLLDAPISAGTLRTSCRCERAENVQLWRRVGVQTRTLAGGEGRRRELEQPGGGVRRQLAVHQLAADEDHLTVGQRHRAAACVERTHQSAADPEHQAVRG